MTTMMFTMVGGGSSSNDNEGKILGKNKEEKDKRSLKQGFQQVIKKRKEAIFLKVKKKMKKARFL
jgi:hypothetical protein